MKKYIISLVIALVVLSGCGSSQSDKITVLTNRTDLVDNLFKEYETDFEASHEGVDIVFEPVENYEDVTSRLSTGDYGDVLLIPSSLSSDTYVDYFLPLGSEEEVSKTYGFISRDTVDGVVYGIPTSVSTNGVVYNSAVFKEAGVENYPSSTEEALSALSKVKEKNKSIPMYTNYGAAWPLGEWTYKTELGFSNNPNWRIEMLTDSEPFAPGKPIYESLSFLDKVITSGYVEDDPATSDWDASKMMLATGEIGSLVIGSWAVPQIAELSENPEDIKFGPLPVKNKNGKYSMEVSPDYALAINKNTKNEELAREFSEYFLSNYAEDTGSLPPTKEIELPDYYYSQDVELIELNTMSTEQEALQEKLKQNSLIDLNSEKVTQKSIEVSLGNSDLSFEDYMKQLNEQWKKAIEEA